MVAGRSVEDVLRAARERRSPEERLRLVTPSQTARELSIGRRAFVLDSALNQARVPEKYRDGNWADCSAAEMLRPWCERIVQMAAAGRGVILSGSVGTGKSTAAGLVAVAAVERGLSVAWEYFPTMLDQLEDRTDRRSAYGRQRVADVLIWDDFGVSQLSPWQVPLIDRVVEHRYSNKKTMIVTTNVQLAMLGEDPTIARIVDRWRERMAGIEMGGASKRRPT